MQRAIVWMKRASILITMLLVSGCVSNSNAANSNVKIGVDTAAGGALQIRSAVAEGYFQEQKVDAELFNFPYGVDTLNALLTGQTDTGLAADYALLNALNRGDMVVLGSLTHSTDETIKYSEILAGKTVAQPEDLVGKRIGVAKGTVSEYHWARYLEHLGISEDEVHYVPYSTPDEAIVGVRNGDIDAVIGSGALLEKFKEIDGVRQIDDLSSAEVALSSYLVADRTFVDENHDVIVGLLKGIKEGMTFVQTTPEGAAKIAYKELKIREEDSLRDLKRTNYTLEFSEEDMNHLKDMQAWIVEKGLLNESYDLSEKLYLDPLQDAFPESTVYEEGER